MGYGKGDDINYRYGYKVLKTETTKGKTMDDSEEYRYQLPSVLKTSDCTGANIKSINIFQLSTLERKNLIRETKEVGAFAKRTLRAHNYDEQFIRTYRVSVKKALENPNLALRELAMKAILEELLNLWTMGALVPVKFCNIPAGERSSIINGHMFLTEKYTADNAFDKMKARYVAGGNELLEQNIGDTYSPTVNIISVMTLINLAAIEDRELRAMDIKGAYLIPDIKPGESNIYVRMDRRTSQIFVQAKPELESYLDAKGCMIFRLRKYLYGLP